MMDLFPQASGVFISRGQVVAPVFPGIKGCDWISVAHSPLVHGLYPLSFNPFCLYEDRQEVAFLAMTASSPNFI